MKKYVLIMEDEEVEATMDGSGSSFEKMVKTFEGAGYVAKEVTDQEYRKEKQRQEKMMWDRDEELFGKCVPREKF